MALNADDIAHIKALWPCISSHAPEYGAEALHRMFTCYPETKTYFPSFDFSPNSAPMKNQGKKVFNALSEMVKHLDHPEECMSHLSDLHAFTLRVDPANYGKFNHCILVTVAVHHSDKLDPCTHQSLDKFLNRASAILTAKYR